MPRYDLLLRSVTLCCVILSSSQPVEAKPICFGSATNHQLTFEVFQLAPPPKTHEPAYPYFPLTAAATMQLGQLGNESVDGVGEYYFQWANRSNAPMTNARGKPIIRKNSIQPSFEGHRNQRTPFTSVAAADACTLAQTASALGLGDAEIGAYANSGAIRTINEGAQPDEGDVGPADTCVLINGRVPAMAKGVVLDYEVGDGRSTAQTLTFLRRFSELVHKAGKRSVLLVDPLNAPSQRYTGISADNAQKIVGLFDLTTIFLWARNSEGDISKSYQDQKSLIEAGGSVDPRRLIIDFDLGETSLADAKAVRGMILNDHLAGVMLWRDRAVQGGDCTTPANEKIQCLLLGCR